MNTSSKSSNGQRRSVSLILALIAMVSLGISSVPAYALSGWTISSSPSYKTGIELTAPATSVPAGRISIDGTIGYFDGSDEFRRLSNYNNQSVYYEITRRDRFGGSQWFGYN